MMKNKHRVNYLLCVVALSVENPRNRFFRHTLEDLVMISSI